MRTCPSCSRDVDEDQRFCGECGTALTSAGEGAPPRPEATETSLGDPAGATPRGSGSFSSDPSQGRFLPGTMLVDRYRIVGLLGRGGMGEVYRADDLKLGQAVALKFLPTALENDAPRLQRLLGEVRLARQVSHPNVCRVYDIGDLDGVPFLSMEYVDGEDLAVLLRRIGRLPKEKALEIARQICAGLAAAHEQNILHRDLKPANVMIDGRGRVKITDFGLAGLAETIQQHEIRAGTPTYMAPEQLAGREVTVRSDIYALGLVLYELITGKAALSGKNFAEIAQKQKSLPASPSSLVDDVDDAVERTIFRCLELDPAQRPASALAVSAALPGGDPLAAALAAGETPSPEMVAEAGETGGLKPVFGTICLAVVLIGMLVSGRFLTPALHLLGYVPLELDPGGVVTGSRATLADLGYPELPTPERHGLHSQQDYLDWIERNDPSEDRWEALRNPRPGGYLYWYRFSEEEIEPIHVHAFSVTLSDPPLSSPGDGRLLLDPSGRLVGFEAIPMAALDDAPQGSFDWSVAFARAGWDPQRCGEVAPIKAPRVPTLQLRACSTKHDDGTEVILQMGSFGSKLTYFETIWPWQRPRSEGSPESGKGALIFGLIAATIMISALWLARRNIRAGRSDLRGAARLALFLVATLLLSWLFLGVRLATLDLGRLFEEMTFGRPLGHALLHALLAGTLYVALEPYVRRLWPQTLVSWTRLLMGRLRDPLVGRDVLIGFALGILARTLQSVSLPVAGWLGRAPPRPQVDFPAGILELREGMGAILNALNATGYVPMALLVLMLLVRLVLRSDWATIALITLLLGLAGPLTETADRGGGMLVFQIVLAVLLWLLVTTCMVRLGLLAVMAMFFAGNIAAMLPPLDLGRWYGGTGLLILAVFSAMAGWAYYVALAGRAVFRDPLEAP